MRWISIRSSRGCRGSIALSAADLKGLDAIIDGELVIRKRRDLIVDC